MRNIIIISDMPIIPLISVELDDDESPEGIDMPLISIAFGDDVFVLLVNSSCSKVVRRISLRERKMVRQKKSMLGVCCTKEATPSNACFRRATDLRLHASL